jgi:hypothetical protein
MIGPITYRPLFACVGKITSLKRSFRASAIGCSQPLGPTRFGPMRTCI